MMVADASVLIAHLDAGDAHHERAGAALADAGARVMSHVVSPSEPPGPPAIP